MPEIPGATASEISGKRFGGPTRVNSKVVPVGTTSTQLMENNPRRVFWMAINRGVNNAAWDWDPTFTFANGGLLGAAGGYVSAEVDEDGESVAWEVRAIADQAPVNVRVFEIMRV